MPDGDDGPWEWPTAAEVEDYERAPPEPPVTAGERERVTEEWLEYALNWDRRES